MVMMMRPASVATLEMGKGTTRSQMSSLVSLHYTCALKCVIPHSVTLRCVTSLFLLCLCQCLDVQDLVTHWVSPTWCPQQFQRFIWLDPEFRKPFFLARKERLTFRQWMCVGGKKNLLDIRWVVSRIPAVLADQVIFCVDLWRVLENIPLYCLMSCGVLWCFRVVSLLCVFPRCPVELPRDTTRGAAYKCDNWVS